MSHAVQILVTSLVRSSCLQLAMLFPARCWAMLCSCLLWATLFSCLQLAMFFSRARCWLCSFLICCELLVPLHVLLVELGCGMSALKVSASVTGGAVELLTLLTSCGKASKGLVHIVRTRLTRVRCNHAASVALLVTVAVPVRRFQADQAQPSWYLAVARGLLRPPRSPNVHPAEAWSQLGTLPTASWTEVPLSCNRHCFGWCLVVSRHHPRVLIDQSAWLMEPCTLSSRPVRVQQQSHQRRVRGHRSRLPVVSEALCNVFLVSSCVW